MEKKCNFALFIFVQFLLLFVNDSLQQGPPISFLKAISQMNVTEFLENLQKGSNDTVGDPVADALWPEDAETASADGIDSVSKTLAVSADTCQTKETIIELPRDKDPNVIGYPMCTMAERCAGCCGSDMLECTNTSAYAVPTQILKYRYSHEDMGMKFKGLFTIDVWHHETCGCHCKIRRDHCNLARQEYLEDSCRCRCYNEVNATKCTSDKVWNERQCECVCPDRVQCHEDEYWDETHCRCEFGFGTPVQSPVEGVGRVDACVGVQCRAGFIPMARDDVCRCEQSDIWGVQAGSNVDWYDPRAGEQPRDPVTTTTTTKRPTTRRPRRPRPSNRRTVARRQRPREERIAV